MGERVLIVNADDFGMSPGVNAGIARAHEHGVVTSASLMVRGKASSEAAAYARSMPSLSLGLHVDLLEWVFHDEEWVLNYEHAPRGDYEAEVAEIQAQLEIFRRLAGRDPSHLDSHQHTHLSGAGATVLIEEGTRLGVPVRHHTGSVRYSGGFYGQNNKGEQNRDAITFESLVREIRNLPLGVTELACHPATAIDFESVYAHERLLELEVLCDPRLREAIDREGVDLVSFTELASSQEAAP